MLPLILLFMATGCATKATTQPGGVEAKPAASGSVIQGITVSEEQTAVVVTIKSNQPLKYSAVKHLFPLGVVLYFPNTSLEGVQETYTPESTLVESIIASEPRGEKGASRVQINLKDDVEYEVNQDKGALLVNFTKPAAGKPAAEEKVAEAPPEPAEPAVTAPEQMSAAGPTEAEAVGKPAWVNRINFLMMEEGKSRVIVRTTEKVEYETQRPSPQRVLLKLFNVKIPKFEKRPLITTRFKSAVDRVVPVQTAQMGDTALIAIELREAVPYRVEQKDNVFFVDFEPSTIPPRPLEDVEMPKWQQVMSETEAVVTGAPVEPSVKVVSLDRGKVYTGQKVSLDFQDADIRNVFRILHEISGKNFIIGEDVKGRVTLKLDKVPWDQVLDLVTRMNKLGIAEEGNIIRIAPLASIEAERVAEKTAKEAEQEAAPLVTEYIPINYSDAPAIQQHLSEVKTERGRLTVDERTNIIIMTDIAEAIDRAKAVVKKLDVVTRQVMIEARIVEAETNFTREIGVQWGFTHQTLRGADDLGGPYGFSGALTPANYAVNLPPGAATSGIGFTFSRFPGNLTSLTIDAALAAQERDGTLKIISAPKVLTLDNKEATIKQGQQVPYTKEEEGTVSITFVDAVLSLTVIPHITMDDRISMKVSATKDSPDFANAVLGQPPIDTKQTTTELLVNNGDTIVIGGIITEEKAVQNAGVPGLSKLPVLGWLFKSKLKRLDKTELLIFITPTIVELEEVSSP
jgi:type IV pilus assembly protein PilQ